MSKRKQQQIDNNMDILKNIQDLPWCKADWAIPRLAEQAAELLKQCTDIPKMATADDMDEAIKRSQQFPIPFPIDTVRLEKLKESRPVDRLKLNIESTYPLVHERVLVLMARFLKYKSEFGSKIEKNLYKDMSIPGFIDRLLKKRAVMFIAKNDIYKLLNGETGIDGWEAIGTPKERPPLVLEDCLSYDEMKISAFVYVSGYTECINDGARQNKGVVKAGVEDHAVIIGVIGPRFKRLHRMDFEDIAITAEQNTSVNGYGEKPAGSCFDMLKIGDHSAKFAYRQMWDEFYQCPSQTYDQLTTTGTIPEKPDAVYTERFLKFRVRDIFDNEVYYKRLCVIAETALLEAEARAKSAGKNVFLNIIGSGLGVWKVADHQEDIYVLTFIERIKTFLDKNLLSHVSDINFAYIKPSVSILDLGDIYVLTFIERIKTFLDKNLLSHVSDINFAYIKPSVSILEAFAVAKSTQPKKKAKSLFLESKTHPNGGITIRLENREPSCKLTDEHEGKLLVLTYAWDSNSHPGNEFWDGSLSSSGDPAAASSTQVAELHNAHINTNVTGYNTKVAGRSGLAAFQEYCGALIT